MEVDLLDDIGDVRVGECQVPEGPREAPELSQISNKRLGRAETLACVSTSAKTGLQLTMPARSRMLRANWH
jgi:hypothetical protein